ncbi:MAG: hypothetical protein GXP21_05195 [Gammaproteobacteria bacterium]|nr:hypothetical protein [Gammaproteobacteria bacterium]
MPDHTSARLRDNIPQDPAQQDAYHILALLQENHGLFNVSAGAGLNAFGHLVGQGNDQTISEISDIYQAYKDDKITKGQYDYRRKTILNQLAKRMGPFDKLFLGGKVNEQLRINRIKGITATHGINMHANRLTKLSGLAPAAALFWRVLGWPWPVGTSSIATISKKKTRFWWKPSPGL